MYHQVDRDTILMEIKGTDRLLLPLKRQLDLKRNSFFDAFVLYHFESNDSFVVDHLIPELEEQRKFKLLIDSRNFTPGRDIKDNIEEAIEDSNSAIIVMSQGFGQYVVQGGVHTLLHREHEGCSIQSVCHYDAAS